MSRRRSHAAEQVFLTYSGSRIQLLLYSIRFLRSLRFLGTFWQTLRASSFQKKLSALASGELGVGALVLCPEIDPVLVFLKAGPESCLYAVPHMSRGAVPHEDSGPWLIVSPDPVPDSGHDPSQIALRIGFIGWDEYRGYDFPIRCHKPKHHDPCGLFPTWIIRFSLSRSLVLRMNLAFCCLWAFCTKTLLV